MHKSLLIAGFGGQGVMVIGQMIGECAFEQGLHVTFLPSYGPEQRGGTANCTIVQSDSPIGAPVTRKLDTLCAMNQPSLEKFIGNLRPGGTLITNSSLVDVSSLQRDDITIVQVDADRIAGEIGNKRTASVVMFAAYMAVSKTVPLDEAKRISLKKLAKKPELLTLNSLAFDRGVETASAALN